MITQERLIELFDYNTFSGDFIRKIKVNSHKASIGTIAGTVCNGYIRVQVDKVVYPAHRLAWLYVYGTFPEGVIDHIDGDGLNNSILNLRDVTSSENNMNMPKRKDNHSSVVGVSYDTAREKWFVKITVNGKQKNLGRYSSFEEAVKVRRNAEKEFGFHINHGRNKCRK